MKDNTQIESKSKMNNIIKYNNGEIEISISIDSNTIWLSQAQISELFDTSIDNISLHLKNIYKEKELDEKSTIEDFSIVRQEGKRKVKRNIKHYNLDAVISIGYRVSSYKATKFRQWATNVLKEYISKGYVINTHKITEQRLLNLENDMQLLKSKIKNNALEIQQGIFYEDQFFDAYIFITDILKQANKTITLIDNYIDEKTLLHLNTKTNKNIKINIITRTITKELKLDIEKYNKQNNNLSMYEYKNSHDRFLIIDERIIYHLGASLKDLGNKWFAFSKLEDDNLELLSKVNKILEGNK